MRSYRKWLAVLPGIGTAAYVGCAGAGAAAAQAKSTTEIVLAWVDALKRMTRTRAGALAP